MSRSKALGEQKQVKLGQGVINYREIGTGQPMLFIHGLVLNGDVWRKVVPELAKYFRCITPDLPLGSHEIGLAKEADLTPAGIARLISDFMEALDLNEVILVGVDTGGAFCQVTIAQYPARIGRLVLSNCDAFENFLPPALAPSQWLAYVPGFIYGLGQLLKLRPVQRVFFGATTKYRIEQEAIASFSGPLGTNPGVRRDVGKVLKGISNRYTLAAATKFKDFDKPVLIAWGKQDRFFPVKSARRLSEAFPKARLEFIDNCRTFVSEDQPERFIELIREFLAQPATV